MRGKMANGLNPFEGRKHTQETKEAISKATKGRIAWNKGIKTGRNLKISLALKGKTPWNKGKNGYKNNRTEESNINMSRASSHYLWKANRTQVDEKHRIRGTREWKEWRSAVFARDNFTCKECGVRGVYLEPHHIVPIRSDWNKLFDTNNGITLCRPCHKLTMYKEEQFIEKYTELLKVVAYC